MSKIHTYYHPIYFVEKDPADTRCTLLIKRFKRYKTSNGNFVTAYKTDTIEYPDEAAMVADIEAQGMKELSDEADGNPSFVPKELRSKTNRQAAKL